MVPTAAEADMALSLGKLLFEQAKFDEAEEQLKIASAGGESDADRQAKLSPDQQREMEQWQQYEAAQPSVDPNADAQKYLRGN
jgi:uncharacterized protein HemY